MGQMNVSITDRIADYVRKSVKSGRYTSASELVREALRKMEAEEQRAKKLASSAEDAVLSLTEEQLASVRKRIRRSIKSIEAGRFVEIRDRKDLKQLTDRVKRRGRKLLARPASRRA
jgi:putative addiction module CopG family antidote